MAKLNQEQKEEIYELYHKNYVPLRVLAAQFGVARTTIVRIVNPQYREQEREQNKQRMKEKRQAYKQKKFYLCFHIERDADIISKLVAVPNKQRYIKDLIRSDLEKSEN